MLHLAGQVNGAGHRLVKKSKHNHCHPVLLHWAENRCLVEEPWQAITEAHPHCKSKCTI